MLNFNNTEEKNKKKEIVILHLNELEQQLHIFLQPLKNKYKKRFPYGLLKSSNNC